MKDLFEFICLFFIRLFSHICWSLKELWRPSLEHNEDAIRNKVWLARVLLGLWMQIFQNNTPQERKGSKGKRIMRLRALEERLRKEYSDKLDRYIRIANGNTETPSRK